MEAVKKPAAPKGGKPPPGTPRNSRRTQIRKRPDRDQIAAELCAGGSLRKLANKYGVDEGSLAKFRRSLPPQLKAAHIAATLTGGRDVDLDQLKKTESESILLVISTQRARLLTAQDRALEDGNATAVASLAGKILECERIIAQLLGELAVLHKSESVSITVTPEYLRLRSVLLKVTAPYPEIRREIAAAIAEIEAEATAKITDKAPTKMIDVKQPEAA